MKIFIIVCFFILVVFFIFAGWAMCVNRKMNEDMTDGERLEKAEEIMQENRKASKNTKNFDIL